MENKMEEELLKEEKEKNKIGIYIVGGILLLLIIGIIIFRFLTSDKNNDDNNIIDNTTLSDDATKSDDVIKEDTNVNKNGNELYIYQKGYSGMAPIAFTYECKSDNCNLYTTNKGFVLFDEDKVLYREMTQYEYEQINNSDVSPNGEELDGDGFSLVDYFRNFIYLENYYDDVNSNHYIYNFEEYNDYIYLKSNTPYEFDSKKNIINSKFTSGGFLSKAEYEISNIKGNSYLSNGLQYWTLTKSSHQKHYMVDYKLLEQLDTNLSGVRITEYTKPDVAVSGLGTYSNPWTFDDMLSIHINSDNKYIGKVSTVECSNEEMRKESIHLNVVGDKARAFYVCPEPGYKFLKSTCSQYITNHNLNNMYTVENLDRDNVICKVYYSYETKKITAYGCSSCATGKIDRTLYVNNTHKIWLLESDGINKIETINDLPTKTGYTFKGYYTSDTNFSEDNKVIESNGKLTYNNQLTTKNQLYPYMKANEYTIKYSCNNGTGATEQSEHTYDEKKNLTSNGCTRQGYKFEGWSTSSTGSKAYSDNQEVLNLTDEDGKEITLYAVWTQCPAGTYGLDGLTCTKCPAGTYNSNKGSKSIDACQKCIAGTYSGKGASSCTQCKEGTYSETIGASSSDTCIKCGLGYYASNKGSTTCSKCPKGTYADKEGLSECISCNTGYTFLITLSITIRSV